MPNEALYTNIYLLQNFLPKLKRHLLPRVLQLLHNEGVRNHCSALPDDEKRLDLNSIVFKHDRMYRHNLFRVNYTMYDVRRSQDMVNGSTSQCNIIVLAEPCDCSDSSTSSHPFRYGRVLGVYHANIVYIGPGMVDYQPRRMEFLWVRWYVDTGKMRAGWEAKKLDRIRFLPVADDDAFGFVDPSDVLRGCQIIPAFARGLLHVDGKGLSSCARDSSDWVEYYVNR
jgi:hypothetical protein